MVRLIHSLVPEEELAHDLTAPVGAADRYRLPGLYHQIGRGLHQRNRPIALVTPIANLSPPQPWHPAPPFGMLRVTRRQWFDRLTTSSG